jgi:hypothetical protein
MGKLDSFVMRMLNPFVPNPCSIHLGMLSRGARLQLWPARSGKASPVRIVAQIRERRNLGYAARRFFSQ